MSNMDPTKNQVEPGAKDKQFLLLIRQPPSCVFDSSCTEGWVTKGKIGYDGAAGVWKMPPFKKRKLYQFIYYSVIAGSFIY